MYVCTSIRPLSPEEVQYRRLVLRNAIICLGWVKFFSICCYITLFILVNSYSEGTWSSIIKVMILLLIPLQTVNASVLFLGAVEDKVIALHLAVWLCVAVATYNTFLGLLGAIYFLRIGYELMHFIIAVIFLFLCLSICVLCHDIIVLYAFLKMIQSPPPTTPMEPELLMLTYNPNLIPTHPTVSQQTQSQV